MTITEFLKNCLVIASPDVTSTTIDGTDPSTNEIDDGTLFELAENYLESDQADVPANVNICSEIEQIVQELQLKIDFLYSLSQPQTITLTNFNFLKINTAVTTVKDKINSLFFDASIPLNWKTNLVWTEKTLPSNETIVDTVTITLLNFIVKEQTKKMLTNYFNKTYNNTIFI